MSDENLYAPCAFYNKAMLPIIYGSPCEQPKSYGVRLYLPLILRAGHVLGICNEKQGTRKAV